MERKILSIVCIAIFLIGCGKDLSRNKAKEILLKEKKSWHETTRIPNWYNSADAGAMEKQNMAEILKKNGYAEYYIERRDYSGNPILRLRPTAKLAPLLAGRDFPYDSDRKVIVGEWVVGEITGITGVENYETVEYTTIFIPNELGKILNISHENGTRSARFKLYDDGWRVE